MLSEWADQVITEGSIALEPFDDLLFPNLQFLNLSIPTIHRHRARCSTARARILDILPNLESLDFGEDVMFPFICRLGQDVRPLDGLTSNLKQLRINFTKHADTHLVTSINAMWLLCLPKLKVADLYLFVKKSEVKFFELHQTAFVKGKTNVTNLSLRLDAGPFVEREELEMILRCFMKTTNKLLYCLINLEGNAFIEPQILHNSIATLESLKLKGGGSLLNFNTSALTMFPNVKVLSIDKKFLTLLLSALKRSFKTSTKPEVMPPSLRRLNLTTNCFASGAEWKRWSRAAGEEHQPKKVFPEFQLGSILLWVSLPISLKEVSSYRRYNHYRDPKSLSDSEKKAFELAREQLRTVCCEKKVRFILLDDLLVDDAH